MSLLSYIAALAVMLIIITGKAKQLIIVTISHKMQTASLWFFTNVFSI